MDSLAAFEPRLCKPVGVSPAQTVSGMEEFFYPQHFASGPVSIMICSPWIGAEPLMRLAELLSKGVVTDSRVYLITMLAHQPAYWNSVVAPALGALAGAGSCRIQVRVLPVPNQIGNVAGINGEALHAKLYVLAQKPAFSTHRSEDQLGAISQSMLLEAFFGSANFTGKGQHCTEHASNHKWELLARAGDPPARLKLLCFFRDLWRSAHRVERDEPRFPSHWHWPYNEEAMEDQRGQLQLCGI